MFIKVYLYYKIKLKRNNRSQGEIFGIALMFVLIILGIIVYGQISSLSPDRDEESAEGLKYTLLAQTALDTIREMSTGCYVERNKDSVSDLIDYCISNSFGDTDPVIECDHGEEMACEYSARIIDSTLSKLFVNTADSDAVIGEIPYTFSIELDYDGASLNGLILTEEGSKTEEENEVRKNELRKDRYQRASSGIYVWESSYREVFVDLNLYYR